MGKSSQCQVDVILGTRPEALKLAPVIRVLRRRYSLRTINTGQQHPLCEHALNQSGMACSFLANRPAITDNLASNLGGLTSALGAQLASDIPDMVIVQGDTHSALAGGLAAHMLGIPLAHVEAGLRSHDQKAPFPEETNRQLLAVLADLHFAPDEKARQALLDEGVASGAIHVVGNPLHDELEYLLSTANPVAIPGAPEILITVHRRESIESGLPAIADAIQSLSKQHPDKQFCLVAHSNPRVRAALARLFDLQESRPNLEVIEPLTHPEFIGRLRRASLLLTDSGGVQEEAAYFNVPVLVLRDQPDRQDGLASGIATVIGTDTEQVIEKANASLTRPGARVGSAGSRPDADSSPSELIGLAIEEFLDKIRCRP